MNWRADPLVLVWLAGTFAALLATGAVAGAWAGMAVAAQSDLWTWTLAGLWSGAGLAVLLGAWLITDRAAENRSRRAFNRVGVALLVMAFWPSLLVVPARGVPFALVGAAATLVAGLASLWFAGRLVAKLLAVRSAS